MKALSLCFKHSGTEFVKWSGKNEKMKHFTLLLALLISTAVFSQRTGEVVIFDDSGYPFHVILNGIMQNSKAESNVRIQDLQASYYKCRVMANDNTFAIDKNIIVKSDTLITYRIINKRGKFKLRFYSEVPLNTAPVASGTQSVIVYHTEETTGTEGGGATSTLSNTTTQSTSTTVNANQQPQSPNNTTVDVNMSASGSNSTQSETVSTSTTTTQTQEGVQTSTGVGTEEESISISMSVSENGANISVQGTGLEGQEGMTMNTEVTGTESGTYTEHSTTTTTTTTTSGTWTTGEEVEESIEMESSEEVDYSDCFVGEEDFDLFMKLLDQETFEDDKTELTTDFVERKCLSVTQIGQLMDAFTFSDNQMAIAKAAYDLCYDTDDYFLLQEKFTFSDEKEELRRFIDNH